MAQGFRSFISSDTSRGQLYEIIVAAIQPRPIAFVSTVSRTGARNLAPFSFFMAGGNNPPSLVYCPTLNARGLPKDSLRNVEETGEFVVNTVTRKMATGMNATGFDYPHETDEWSVSGFTTLESKVVRPQRIAESPIHFECKLFEILTHGSGPGASRYIVGEIVAIHVAEAIWSGRGIDGDLYRPIARMGGPNYLDTENLELFELQRPAPM